MLRRLCFALCAFALGANAVPVAPGAGTLSAAIAAAADGDTFELSEGVYTETAPITINKRIAIKGRQDNGTVIEVDPAQVPILFKMDVWNSTFQYLTVRTTNNNSECNFNEPIALTANFSMALLSSYVRSNTIWMYADLGAWFNTRELENLHFGNCSYKLHANDHIYRHGLDIFPGTCRAGLNFSVPFDHLLNCNATVVTTDTFKTYTNQIETEFRELVDRVNKTELLLIAVNRTGNAVTKLTLQVDRVANVIASVAVSYPDAELQAAIQKIETAIDGKNLSRVTIVVSLPSPFTLFGFGNGSLAIIETAITGTNTSLYQVGSACNNLDTGSLCNQTIVFNITTCDLSGRYQLRNVSMACIEADSNGTPLECPSITSGADVYFDIEANNFCEEVQYNLSALFTPDILLREDPTYLTNRPTFNFNLGDMSYWSIRLWTNATGVGLDDAVVIKVVRTSTTPCTPYGDFMFNVDGNLAQEFVNLPTVDPPEIRFPLSVTAAMACADASTNGSVATLNYTVRVTYTDSSVRRRRRSTFNMDAIDMAQASFPPGFRPVEVVHRNRRNTGSGALFADKEVGIGFASSEPAPIVPVIVPVQGSSSSSTTAKLIAIATVTTVLLCCSCMCSLAAILVYRRRAKKIMEEEEVLTHNGAKFGRYSSAVITQSSANLDDGSSTYKSNTDMLGRRSTLRV